jgi:hypothetical protein
MGDLPITDAQAHGVGSVTSAEIFAIQVARFSHQDLGAIRNKDHRPRAW